MPLFLVLFQVVRSGRLTWLAWAAVLTVIVRITAWLVARRRGVGYWVVDEWGRPVRRPSRSGDGIPRLLRKRPIVSREEFLQRTSSGGK